jgi:hypothetical protein
MFHKKYIILLKFAKTLLFAKERRIRDVTEIRGKLVKKGGKHLTLPAKLSVTLDQIQRVYFFLSPKLIQLKDFL